MAKILYERQRRLGRNITIAIAVVAALVGATYLLVTGTVERGTPLRPVPQQAKASPGTAQPAQHLATSKPAASPQTNSQPLTKSQLVESYLRKSNPVDAFNAYKLLRDCVRARRAEREGTTQQPSSAEVCGDITPAQIVGRIRALETAAQAGVKGAFIAYVWEGPDGSGEIITTPERANDPSTAEYRGKVAEYQRIAAENGDRSALIGMSIRAENEDRDYFMSLAYWVAQEQVSLAQGEQSNKRYANVVARLSQRLSSDQAALAIEKGMRIALAAQASPYWSHK